MRILKLVVLNSMLTTTVIGLDRCLYDLASIKDCGFSKKKKETLINCVYIINGMN